MSETIRIFIGTEPKTEIARKVLEHSIRRRLPPGTDIAFTPMLGPEWTYDASRIPVGTGFSLRRWMIPAACQWQGRAIYLDADQLVFGDIRELWRWPEEHPAPPGTSAWMTWQPDKFSSTPWPQSSVMVIDCAAALAQWGWKLEEAIHHLRQNPTKKAYADFMHATWMTPPPGVLPVEWNHLNEWTPSTKLLHYTREDFQPWYDPTHPHANLWREELRDALRQGAVRHLDMEVALSRWNLVEDWRKHNGLHPSYRSLLNEASA